MTNPTNITKKYIKEALGLDLNTDCQTRCQEYLKSNKALPAHPFMDDTPKLTEAASLSKDTLLNILSYYNPENRPIKLGKAVNLLKDMLSGNWMSTGDTVKFGNKKNGYALVDAQHRILALLLAKHLSDDDNFDVNFDVASGREPEIKVKIDRQQIRSQKDHLIMNYPHIVPNATSARIASDVAKRILKHYLKPEGQMVVCASSDPTDEEVESFLVENKEAVYTVLSYLTIAKSDYPCSAENLKKLRKTAVVNALVRFAMTNVKSCEDFLKVFVSGQATNDADYTVLKLRDYVLNSNAQSSARGKKGTGYDDLYAKTIYSCINWFVGVKIKKLVKQKNWESYDYARLASANAN
jgi:hypothetical protein